MRRLIRFCMVGGVTAVIHYGVLLTLVECFHWQSTLGSSVEQRREATLKRLSRRNSKENTSATEASAYSTGMGIRRLGGDLPACVAASVNNSWKDTQRSATM